MYTAFGDDFLFGSALAATPSKRRKARKIRINPLIETVSHTARRQEAILRLTEEARRENERYRKPCPTCGTLVKPKLQGQHNAAYHTKK